MIIWRSPKYKARQSTSAGSGTVRVNILRPYQAIQPRIAYLNCLTWKPKQRQSLLGNLNVRILAPTGGGATSVKVPIFAFQTNVGGGI